MKPRFTDSHKYPHGYRSAADTNVTRTFERVRREIRAKAEQEQRDKEEAQRKVSTLKARKA